MNPLVPIDCLWQAYCRTRLRRERLLRQRVAFMLWEMANRIE
jgi:hypothetical protein